MATTEHRPTERVLDILELLSNSEEGMTLTELAKALNAPKSSIMPLVHTMTARKFICKRIRFAIVSELLHILLV